MSDSVLAGGNSHVYVEPFMSAWRNRHPDFASFITCEADIAIATTEDIIRLMKENNANTILLFNSSESLHLEKLQDILLHLPSSVATGCVLPIGANKLLTTPTAQLMAYCDWFLLQVELFDADLDLAGVNQSIIEGNLRKLIVYNLPFFVVFKGAAQEKIDAFIEHYADIFGSDIFDSAIIA